MSFNNWHTADPDAVATEQGEPPEPGTYDAALIEASALTSKKGEDWVILKWERNVDGHQWPQILGFKSQSQANFTKNQVRELGIDVNSTACSSLDGLNAELQRVVSMYYTVEVVQNGEYRNTYIRERAASGAPPSDLPVPTPQPVGAAIGAVADEDIPF